MYYSHIYDYNVTSFKAKDEAEKEEEKKVKDDFNLKPGAFNKKLDTSEAKQQEGKLFNKIGNSRTHIDAIAHKNNQNKITSYELDESQVARKKMCEEMEKYDKRLSTKKEINLDSIRLNI